MAHDDAFILSQHEDIEALVGDEVSDQCQISGERRIATQAARIGYHVQRVVDAAITCTEVQHNLGRRAFVLCQRDGKTLTHRRIGRAATLRAQIGFVSRQRDQGSEVVAASTARCGGCREQIFAQRTQSAALDVFEGLFPGAACDQYLD